jgi:hypothetical protein
VTCFARLARIANLSDIQYATTFMTTDKTTKNQRAPPPMAAPMPTSRPVSPAISSQVRRWVAMRVTVRDIALESPFD